jgi:hypothetical protein
MGTVTRMVAAGIVVGAAVTPAAAVDPERSSVPLRGLVTLGRVVVTASDGTVDEAVLREAVERRLVQAGLTVDGASPVDLIVNVSAERRRSEDGHCTFERFMVSLALREPVSIDRAPGEVFPATTWSVAGSVSHFGSRAPRLSILDVLQDQISAFLRARGMEQQTPN